MKKLFLFFLILLFTTFTANLFIKAEEDEAPTNDGIIAVYVQTSQYDKIEGMSINVRSASYNQSKTTDVQGKAVFSDLEYGDYTVTLNLPDNSEYILVTGETPEKNVTVTDSSTNSVYFGVKKNPNYKDPNTPETVELILPSIFKGKTTDLNGKTREELKNIENFTLEVPGKVKIVFSEKIDFSSDDTISRLRELDKYAVLDQLGTVSIKSDLMPELDKPAKITFFDLKYIPLGNDYTPLILTDSVINTTAVKNISLRGDKIEFEVTGFSTYSLSPQLKFTDIPEEVEESELQLTGKIDDLDANIIVYLNGQLLDQNISINDKGEFTINLNFEDKENEIKIITTGISGEQTTQTFKITYTGSQKSEETPTQGNNVSQTFSIILALFLVITGISSGAWYYYRTKKNLPIWPFGGDKESNEQTVPQAKKYDERLLTEEEKKLFKTKQEPPKTISL